MVFCTVGKKSDTSHPGMIGFLRGLVIPLIFPKFPQSSLGILRVPQLPPPLGHRPLKNPIMVSGVIQFFSSLIPFHIWWGPIWWEHSQFLSKCIFFMFFAVVTSVKISKRTKIRKERLPSFIHAVRGPP